MNKSLRKSVGQNLKKKWWYKWSLGGKKREKGAKKFEKKKMKDQNFLNLMKDINIPM